MKRADFTHIFLQFVICVSLGIFAWHPCYEGAFAVVAGLASLIAHFWLVERRRDRISRTEIVELYDKMKALRDDLQQQCAVTLNKQERDHLALVKTFTDAHKDLHDRIEANAKQVATVSKAMNINKVMGM